MCSVPLFGWDPSLEPSRQLNCSDVILLLLVTGNDARIGPCWSREFHSSANHEGVRLLLPSGVGGLLNATRDHGHRSQTDPGGLDVSQ